MALTVNALHLGQHALRLAQLRQGMLDAPLHAIRKVPVSLLRRQFFLGLRLRRRLGGVAVAQPGLELLHGHARDVLQALPARGVVLKVGGARLLLGAPAKHDLVLVEPAVLAHLVDHEHRAVVILRRAGADEGVDVVAVVALGALEVAVVALQGGPLRAALGPGRVLDRHVQATDAGMPLLVVAGLFLPLGWRRQVVLRAGRGFVRDLVYARTPAVNGTGDRGATGPCGRRVSIRCFSRDWLRARSCGVGASGGEPVAGDEGAGLLVVKSSMGDRLEDGALRLRPHFGVGERGLGQFRVDGMRVDGGGRVRALVAAHGAEVLAVARFRLDDVALLVQGDARASRRALRSLHDVAHARPVGLFFKRALARVYGDLAVTVLLRARQFCVAVVDHNRALNLLRPPWRADFRTDRAAGRRFRRRQGGIHALSAAVVVGDGVGIAQRVRGPGCRRLFRLRVQGPQRAQAVELHRRLFLGGLGEGVDGRVHGRRRGDVLHRRLLLRRLGADDRHGVDGRLRAGDRRLGLRPAAGAGGAAQDVAGHTHRGTLPDSEQAFVDDFQRVDLAVRQQLPGGLGSRFAGHFPGGHARRARRLGAQRVARGLARLHRRELFGRLRLGDLAGLGRVGDRRGVARDGALAGAGHAQRDAVEQGVGAGRADALEARLLEELRVVGLDVLRQRGAIVQVDPGIRRRLADLLEHFGTLLDRVLRGGAGRQGARGGASRASKGAAGHAAGHVSHHAGQGIRRILRHHAGKLAWILDELRRALAGHLEERHHRADALRLVVLLLVGLDLLRHLPRGRARRQCGSGIFRGDFRQFGGVVGGRHAQRVAGVAHALAGTLQQRRRRRLFGRA